jgi:hypothetical protein
MLAPVLLQTGRKIIIQRYRGPHDIRS